ncbi:hypothetical protein IWX64_003325 [Arthrobacter sp. CAN_A212]|uniref:DUF5703 family protein n=1 Tax=unclassified Arthrobacter TaxID=235627 RepID=UPI0018CAB940|nr:DUF5703 family protein [Arthrobacter sp. CAN_C5]MBP2216668.1 hypothetical protein [Arthrobacter sp. CAN_C5]
MREQFLNATTAPKRGVERRYEYLVLTVKAGEPVNAARQALTEHAEYGKWELERSCIYIGGGRRYWMRRKVMRVERTA